MDPNSSECLPSLPFPPEFWATVVTYGLGPRDLQSLSLTCTTLRNIAQQMLFSEVALKAGRVAKCRDLTGPFRWLVAPTSSDWKANALERLRFILSPRIAFSVNSLRIKYDRDSHSPIFITEEDGHSLLDEIISALPPFIALRHLEFVFSPIFTHHATKLRFLPLEHLRITFVQCAIVGSDHVTTRLPCESLRIVAMPHRATEIGHGAARLFEMVLTPSLVNLHILTCPTSTVFEEASRTWKCLEALHTLSVDEQSSASLIPHLHLFSNVHRLTIYPSPHAQRNSKSLAFPSDAFPQVQVLACPIHLLSLWRTYV
jgi:hypothetical protein